MLDQQIFLAIFHLAGQRVWLDTLAIFFSQAIPYLLFISLLIFVVMAKQKKRELIMLAMAAGACVLSRGIIVSLIRLLWHRDRPFLVLHLNPLIPYSNEASFPSGHAAFLFALALVVLFYHKKIGILFLFLAAISSLARVYVGIHWPSDILVGAIVGILSGWLIYVAYRKKVKNHSYG